ncbi:MAG: hypothetical protein A2359_01125 [Candidatus Moranbacteria bacterium RIFOXYB1_FULL_43_19]|nr:MAG: hypothetical protein A2359_01125 [Candidatus Moranbacteria bacterium RIFOXYB1_FULL_43_19]OGI33014.1 MAG: hypothetical protein A2420_01550 [Candidatus Moranbacteria bacterium RIFOXYC1_FULL_44_13]OGI38427.1 MAG: hypothetical protein A2612_01605 [Candidatus Moranbacteria bacterium RIFOXYD1_FULL_44_12]
MEKISIPSIGTAFKEKAFLRYSVIGGFCALADIAVLFFFVNYLHLFYLTAATFSFVIITFFGYFGQKFFTFRDSSKNHKRQIPFFFIVAGSGLVLNTFFMFLFVSIAGIWYIIANVLTKAIVFIWNFLANKKFVFH